MDKKHLITAALPYANNHLHLGHLAGVYLRADVHARFLRSKGLDVLFICGSDEHGTAIEKAALEQKTTCLDIVNKYHKANNKVLSTMDISFDTFSRTSNNTHHNEVTGFVARSLEQSPQCFEVREIKQYYDDKAKMFLADRFIVGKCPSCGGAANGSQCDNCGISINSEELIEPISCLTGLVPVLKETEHVYFVPTKAHMNTLTEWLENHPKMTKPLKNELLGWLKQGFNPRSITRDLEWGISTEILAGSFGEKFDNKVFYVWYDAPIGYITATKEVLEHDNLLKDQAWQDREITNFIGKDNNVFHGIIFPLMLLAHNKHYQLPTNIISSNYLTIGSRVKMSKSSSNGVLIKDYIERGDSIESLRAYLSAICPVNADSVYSEEQHKHWHNTILIGKIFNYLNRVTNFVYKNYNGKVPIGSRDYTIMNQLYNNIKKYKNAMKYGDSKKAFEIIIQVAINGNGYLSEQAPWHLTKEDTIIADNKARDCLVTCMEVAAALAVMLKPFTPTSVNSFQNNILNKELNIIDLKKGDEKYPILVPTDSPLREPYPLIDKWL